MPEGDSIHHTAAAMRIALVDKKMVRFDAPHLIGVVPKAGRTIVRIESESKHLEIEWDDGIILHTHLRKSGFWDLYRKDDIWQRPHREMRALIDTSAWTAVCFNAPTVETYREPGISRHPWFGRLGPDLGSVDADLDRCVELLLSYDDRRAPISEVLLDQRVFCGVGNLYRSEVLWACEVHPFAAIGDLGEALARRIVHVAARLVRANLVAEEQVALPGVPGGLGVYGRTGQGCYRCAETVRARHRDTHERILYWCPGCQTRLVPAAPSTPDLPTDQHPAAKAFRADDTPWLTAG
ncbi:MAG: nei [Desertimonas sp.]|nr:nei [Desertimonas sp.]